MEYMLLTLIRLLLIIFTLIFIIKTIKITFKFIKDYSNNTLQKTNTELIKCTKCHTYIEGKNSDLHNCN